MQATKLTVEQAIPIALKKERPSQEIEASVREAIESSEIDKELRAAFAPWYNQKIDLDDDWCGRVEEKPLSTPEPTVSASSTPQEFEAYTNHINDKNARIKAELEKPSEHPAAIYIRKLFHEGDRVLVQLIHATKTYVGKNDGKPHACTEEYPRSLTEATSEGFIGLLKSKNAEGWNIYVTMNPIKKDSVSRKKADIACVRSVYMEVDENGDECRVAVTAAIGTGEIPEPSYIFESSPHKFQFIWFINDNLSTPQQEGFNRALQIRFRTDPESVDVSRVLRLPGFYNQKQKYAVKPLVTTVSECGGVYSRTDFKISPDIRAEKEMGEPIGHHLLDAIAAEIERHLQKAGLSFAKEVRATSDWIYQYTIDCPNELHTTATRRRNIAIRKDGLRGSHCYHSNCDGNEFKWIQEWLEKTNGEKMVFPKTVQKRADEYRLDFMRPEVSGPHNEYVLAPILGSGEGWFPLGDPSLIGGPSGGSKTTLMIALLEAQRRSESYLGHPSYGMPYLVLMADRGKNAHLRTMERMGLNPDDVPIKFLPMVQGEPAVQAILAKIEECEALPRVVFIEGCDMLVADASKLQVVAPFMRSLQSIASRYHLAIVGSVGSAKQRIGEGYTSKRDHIFGSIGWGRASETIVVMQYVEGDDTDLRRIVSVLPRNAAAEKFKMMLENGQLVIDNRPPEEAEKEIQKELVWFRQQKDWFTVMDVKRSLRTSRTSAQRWVADAFAKHILKKKPGRQRGAAEQFKWNDGNQNPEKGSEIDVNLDSPEAKQE